MFFVQKLDSLNLYFIVFPIIQEKPNKQRLNQTEQICFISLHADRGMPKITE